MTLRAVVRFALYVVVSFGILFVSAGTLAWPMAWVYASLSLVMILGSRLLVLRKWPDALRERGQFTEAEGVQSWDRLLSFTVGLLGPTVIGVVAGLDHRFGWSPTLPDLVVAVATLLVAVGFGLGTWAMVANRYFSAVARIQRDRGQSVMRGGPYRLVRHPAYAGALLSGLATPVMLSALWAWVPALGTVVAVVIRTRLEDRMLLEGLEGYADYAAVTRYRLIPGIW
jgi:protein-S-isoprenylcysteine O-methyltransferase Ste14